MLIAIGDSLSDPAKSDDDKDGDDEDRDDEDDEDTEPGRLSKDDEPWWVMGTISKTIQQRMESFRQKQSKIDELTQPEWGNAADYFSERDMKFWRTIFKVPPAINPQTDEVAAVPALTTFWDLITSPDIVPGTSLPPQLPCWLRRSHMKLGVGKC